MAESIPDPKSLAAAGWTRQNTASEPRLSEAVALYESLGMEVLLVPLQSECIADGGADRCTACFEGDPDPERHRVIYTRPRREGVEAAEDLF